MNAATEPEAKHQFHAFDAAGNVTRWSSTFCYAFAEPKILRRVHCGEPLESGRLDLILDGIVICYMVIKKGESFEQDLHPHVMVDQLRFYDEDAREQRAKLGLSNTVPMGVGLRPYQKRAVHVAEMRERLAYYGYEPFPQSCIGQAIVKAAFDKQPTGRLQIPPQDPSGSLEIAKVHDRIRRDMMQAVGVALPDSLGERPVPVTPGRITELAREMHAVDKLTRQEAERARKPMYVITTHKNGEEIESKEMKAVLDSLATSSSCIVPAGAIDVSFHPIGTAWNDPTRCRRCEEKLPEPKPFTVLDARAAGWSDTTSFVKYEHCEPCRRMLIVHDAFVEVARFFDCIEDMVESLWRSDPIVMREVGLRAELEDGVDIESPMLTIYDHYTEDEPENADARDRRDLVEDHLWRMDWRRKRTEWWHVAVDMLTTQYKRNHDEWPLRTMWPWFRGQD